MMTLPIFVYGVITPDMAHMFVANLLFFQNVFGDEPEKYVVKVYINSPGGYVTDLMSMIDAMDNVSLPIETYCLGQAASCGAVLLSKGNKGKRFIGKNSRVMIHQVSSGAIGKLDEIQISVDEAKRLNEQLIGILSKNSKKKKSEIKKDLETDLFMNAKQAVEYGLADKVLTDNADEIKELDEHIEKKLFDVDATHMDWETKHGDMENKSLEVNFEVKSIDETDDCYVVKGYSGIYGIQDRYDDIIDKGAFSRTLKNCSLLDQPNERTLLWQHDTTQPIGRTVLTEDSKGLKFVAYLPKADTFVRDRVMPQLKMKSIQTMSFGYKTVDFYYKDRMRHLKDVDLFEVSVVTIPAIDQARIVEVKNKDLSGFDFGDIKSISDFFKGLPLTKKERDDIFNTIKRSCKENAAAHCKDGDYASITKSIKEIINLYKRS